MPILHFRGNFKNQPPIYNNSPYNVEKYLDNTDPKTIKKELGSDPVEYFEFKFENVYISKITYDDGTSTNKIEEDILIGKRVMLKGFLVDTAPHLLRSRLYAGELRIADLFTAKVEEGYESDLFTTIRNTKPDNNNVDKKIERALPFSADFECNIYDIESLAADPVLSGKSRFYREFKITKKSFKIFFHLSKFIYYPKLQGEVHGYVGQNIPDLDDNYIKIHGRRLLVDPCISNELKQDFKLEDFESESYDIGRNDLEGTYEILIDKRLVVLRYLNFIPYIDNENNTPIGYKFYIILFNDSKEINPHQQIEIKVDRKSISESGGISIIQLPDFITDPSKLSICIKTRKNNGEIQPFMKEPEYDLLIKENQRYLVLESKKMQELKIKVYYKNRPLLDKNIRAILQANDNNNSPIVARWTTDYTTSDNDSIFTCNIQAHDLENSKEIDDVIIIGYDNQKKKIITGKLSGDLPWDRYYGNYLSIKIDNSSIITSNNKKEPIIKFNIPVRVLHSVPLEDLKSDIENLDKETIQLVMDKIFSYYVRYYPYLHTQYVYTEIPPAPAKLSYSQFLRIKEFLIYVEEEDLDNWELIQKCVNNINHLLDRLTKEDNDWKKMPRSRDFPFNGVEFLKKYKARIIDRMIQNIKDKQESDKVLQEQSELEIDMDNWRQVQDLLNNLEYMSSHLSNKEKELVAIWSSQIYDNLIHSLNMAKTQTKHVHKH